MSSSRKPKPSKRIPTSPRLTRARARAQVVSASAEVEVRPPLCSPQDLDNKETLRADEQHCPHHSPVFELLPENENSHRHAAVRITSAIQRSGSGLDMELLLVSPPPLQLPTQPVASDLPLFQPLTFGSTVPSDLEVVFSKRVRRRIPSSETRTLQTPSPATQAPDSLLPMGHSSPPAAISPSHEKDESFDFAPVVFGDPANIASLASLTTDRFSPHQRLLQVRTLLARPPPPASAASSQFFASLVHMVGESVNELSAQMGTALPDTRMPSLPPDYESDPAPTPTAVPPLLSNTTSVSLPSHLRLFPLDTALALMAAAAAPSRVHLHAGLARTWLSIGDTTWHACVTRTATPAPQTPHSRPASAARATSPTATTTHDPVPSSSPPALVSGSGVTHTSHASRSPPTRVGHSGAAAASQPSTTGLSHTPRLSSHARRHSPSPPASGSVLRPGQQPSSMVMWLPSGPPENQAQANWFSTTNVTSNVYFLLMSAVRVMLRCYQGPPTAFLATLPPPILPSAAPRAAASAGPDATAVGPSLIDAQLARRVTSDSSLAFAQCILEWALIAAACAPGPVCSEWWRVVGELALVGVDVSDRLSREASLGAINTLLQCEEQTFIAVHRARRLGPPRVTSLVFARFCLDLASRECFGNYRVWMRLCLVLAQMAEEGHNTYFDAMQAASFVTSNMHIPPSERECFVTAVETTRMNLQTSPTALRPAPPPTPQKGPRL
eukprot:m.242473 g.242473  ORF g.242473 m.242473 type:complete len:726 (+) comp25724_c0_seq1:68-2245(+)